MIYSADLTTNRHEMRDDVTHNTTRTEPPFSDHEFPDRDGRTLRVHAQLLGFTTSERDTHGHDGTHQDDEDVDATLRWAGKRRTELQERLSTRQLSPTDYELAVRALDVYEQLLRRPDVPAHRKPWYQIEPGRCSHCRWFEARVLRVRHELTGTCTCGAGSDLHAAQLHTRTCGVEDPSGRYLVLTYGRTRVPGETDKRRSVWTNSAFEVVEVLVQRDRGEKPFLPAASARVLAQAAQWDEDISDAFVNRAVA